jgi:hypothetical protein
MRDLDYESNNIAYDHQYPKETGGGIKCKNYDVCAAVLPVWWFECKGEWLCTGCDEQFGTWTYSDGIRTIKHTGKGILDTKENIECPICLECSKGISQPNCNHYICINCFKRCYYGDVSDCPQFPYPEVEDEYYEDQENSKWADSYPLIKLYDEAYDIWYYNHFEKYEKEDYLRKCPLCRK